MIGTKRMAGAVASAAMIVIWATASQAAPVTGVFPGNDPFPDPLNDSPSLAKCDDISESSPFADCGFGGDDWKDGAATGDYSDAFSISFTDSKSGTWTYNPALVTGTGSPLSPHYLAIKAGNNYEVVDILGLLTGSWDTGSLDDKDVSHLSFYNSGTVIPLPAALPMFLAGLAGLGLVGWRRRAA
jgi:hypothetical protein